MEERSRGVGRNVGHHAGTKFRFLTRLGLLLLLLPSKFRRFFAEAVKKTSGSILLSWAISGFSNQCTRSRVETMESERRYDVSVVLLALRT